MKYIETVSQSSQSHHQPVQRDSSSQSQRNRFFGALIIGYVLFAPLPFGSNRPFFWAISGFVLALMSIFYFVSLRRNGNSFRAEPKNLKLLVYPFLAFLFYMALQIMPLGIFFQNGIISLPNHSALTSQSISLAPSMGVLSLVQYATYGLLFFLVLQVARNPDRAERMFTALFFGVVLYALYGIVALTQLGDSILFLEKRAYLGSATSTFVNRNSFATFLSFGLIIGSGFTARAFLPNSAKQSHSQDLTSGMLYLSGTAIIVAALLATQSRMGVFSGGVGAFFTILLVLTKAPHPKSSMSLFLVISLIGGSLMISLYGEGLLERIGHTQSSANIRLALYDQVLGLIAQRPFLGYGAASFELVFPFFHQLPVNPDLVWDKAHNSYFTLWSELGIIFGSIPIFLVLVTALKAGKLVRLSKRRWLHGVILLGAITTAGVHSLADFSLEIHSIALIFVTLLALGIAGLPKTTGSTQS